MGQVEGWELGEGKELCEGWEVCEGCDSGGVA